MATDTTAQPLDTPTDVDLVDAVSRELRKSAKIDFSAVRVAADAGRVRLTGRVATHAERLAAARLAARTAGVAKVENALTVRDVDLDVVARTDAELSEAVGAAIVQSTVEVADLKFGVSSHVVTIEGRVHSERDRAALGHAVQHVPGVHFVQNRVGVEESPAGPDAIDELDPTTCFRLLARERVGRLAVQEATGVDVFPVNYLVHDRKVYFRSGPGVKMIRITQSPDVAFEVDGNEGDWAWSVVVKGTAARLDDDDEIVGSGIADARTAHGGDKHNYVRITPRQISGRRFRRAP